MKQRYDWIDNIRGIAMLSMIAYHTVWDLVYLYGMEWTWYAGRFAKIWQQSICWTFILLSGFCWSFSKNPLRQGAVVSGCGLIVTAVTLIFSYESRVIFGVLSMIGASALLLIPLKKVFEKIPSGIGFVLFFLAFAVFYSVNDRYLGFFGLKIAELPQALYTNLFTTFLGFCEPSFFSTDYFSLVPWAFLYFAGYFLHRLWREGKLPGANCLNRKLPFLTVFGKRALIVYMLHQPIIYAVLQIAFYN